jgi:hypothetical protein
MAMSEDMSEEYGDVSPSKSIPQFDDPISPSNTPEVEMLISLNALTGISTPQNLKLIGYIKNRKFIILIDSDITDNFIHHHNA